MKIGLCTNELHNELDCRTAEFELDAWCDRCRDALEALDVRYCRVCGCTDDDPCLGTGSACAWLPTGLEGALCSSCGLST